MLIAVDKGTTYTKTSKQISFKSTIREYQDNELDFSQDKIIVEYNNKQYVIGEKGKQIPTYSKVNKKKLN